MATEYISREAAIKEFCDDCMDMEWCKSNGYSCSRIDNIKAVPAADVRPVVTCGKCKYGKYTGVSWFCDKHSGHADKFGEDASYHEYHYKHWFCADGEERNHG